MYTRYYDPNIFLHTLDGIDRSNYLIATDDRVGSKAFAEVIRGAEATQASALVRRALLNR